MEEEEDDEGGNGKQQCGNMLFPAEETKGKHRNWKPHNLYTLHAKHVIIMPEDIQITLPYM